MEAQQQQELAFGAAEGHWRHRKDLVERAARAAGAKLEEICFAVWVFEHGRPWQISVNDLARKLCCSPETARAVVKWVCDQRLVHSKAWEPGDGPNRANSYATDTAGVRRALGYEGPENGPSENEGPFSDAAMGGGETPRTGAGAGGRPSFNVNVPSLTSSFSFSKKQETTTNETNDAPAREGPPLASACRQLCEAIWPGRSSRLTDDERIEVRTLGVVILAHHRLDWALDVIRRAGKASGIKRRLAYAKGSLKASSGNAAEFLRRVDAARPESRAWFQKRSPP